MRGLSRDLLDAGVGDAVALFDGEGMVGRFQCDIRPPLHIFRLDVGFQVKSIGIAGEFVGKPSEIRRLVDDFGVVPELYHARNIFVTQRSPDTPHEELVGFDDGNRNKPADEEITFVDSAEVRSEFTAGDPFGFRDLFPMKWSIEGDVQGKAIVVFAADSAGIAGGRMV